MHPLLSRIIWRGLIVGAALAAMAWYVPILAEKYLNDQNVTIIRTSGPNWQGPLVFALAGVGLLAVLESIVYARERYLRKPPAA